MNGEAGKGSAPRQGQYSKKSRIAYAEGYDRIFGRKCTICKGKGYHVDWDEEIRKTLKTVCIICKGTGKLEHHPGCPNNDLEDVR